MICISNDLDKIMRGHFIMRVEDAYRDRGIEILCGLPTTCSNLFLTLRAPYVNMDNDSRQDFDRGSWPLLVNKGKFHP